MGARGGCRETATLTKDDDGDVDGAEDAELVGLLEEAVLALAGNDRQPGPQDT